MSGDEMPRNPITGIAGCCARAASGHAAEPPSSEINSRRLTVSPSLLETAPYHIVEWDSILHHSKFDSLVAG